MLPADWQRQMVEMVRGAAPLDGAWFAGGPSLSPLEQIGVYREQFRMRLTEALRAELPGLVALVGEGVEALFEAFLLDHPPVSWSLDHAAQPFAGWLAGRGAPPEQVDMATLDGAVSACFLAADAAPAPPEALSPDRRLVLAPSARLLRLRADLHRFRAAALSGQIPTAPRPEAWPLLIYRAEHGPRHWELDPPTDAALSVFARCGTALEAAEAALAAAPEAAATLGAVFHEIAARRVLCVADAIGAPEEA